MEDFRTRLKSETRKLHYQLEEQYPFKQLVEATCDEKDLRNVVFCFFQKFDGLVAEKKNEDKFYSEIGAIFENFRDSHKESSQNLSHLDQLSLEYLLLGSRMGNTHILKKRPEIARLPNSQYLKISFPSTIWKELLAKISNISSTSEQEEFISKVNSHYHDLISLGIEKRS